MKVWSIWIEGYAVTGNSGTAQFLGQYAGETFADACAEWNRNRPENDGLFSPGGPGQPPSYWGCRMFDNAEDAHKGFG